MVPTVGKEIEGMLYVVCINIIRTDNVPLERRNKMHSSLVPTTCSHESKDGGSDIHQMISSRSIPPDEIQTHDIQMLSSSP